jgi:SAM-dependent methyltransferase
MSGKPVVGELIHSNEQAMNEFERWENRFTASEYIFGTEPNRFLASCRLMLPKHGRALAIADGEGRNGVWLAEQGLDVLSIDFSPAAQAKARALAQTRGVKLATEIVDLARYDWPEAAFDVVVDIFTQFFGPDERAAKFAGIRRSLKPGGLLLLQGYRPEQIAYGTGGPKSAENMYTRALLEREFASFKRIRVDEADIEMSEGSAHAGMSAVIDLVGWK